MSLGFAMAVNVMAPITNGALPRSFTALAISKREPGPGGSCRNSLRISAVNVIGRTENQRIAWTILSPTYSISKRAVKKTVGWQLRNGGDSELEQVSLLENKRLQGQGSTNVPWGRKWANSDLVNLVAISSMHLLCLFAPFTFNWNAFLVGLVLTLITGKCITLSYHRNLSHKSFNLPKWLEYLFAYCAAHALQRDPLFWVSVHRYHHQYVDTERDPHSPLEGFWFSHMGWIMDTEYIAQKVGEAKGGEYSNVDDLKRQPFYRFLHNTYFMHIVGLGIVLYALGGFPFVVFGMGMRITISLHGTFLVNSVCHTWGKRVWNTRDDSKNNWLVGLLSFGEGWHNNHHAFPNSARHGLEWWQIDTTWYFIKFLQAIGLATNLMLPADAQIHKMAFSD